MTHTSRYLEYRLLHGECAVNGEQIVVSLIRQLKAVDNRGFMRRILSFAEVLPAEEIIYALRRQLPCGHCESMGEA
jgi:hypothetical protein